MKWKRCKLFKSTFRLHCINLLYASYSYRKKQKDKLKEIRKKRKLQQAESAASEEGKALLQDERFKSVDSSRFEKKRKGQSQAPKSETDKKPLKRLNKGKPPAQSGKMKKKTQVKGKLK